MQEGNKLIVPLGDPKLFEKLDSMRKRGLICTGEHKEFKDDNVYVVYTFQPKQASDEG